MAQFHEQVTLSEFTTIRLGGPARRFVEAATDEEIIAEVRAADERAEPLLVLGGGSNLLISDDGYKGLVLQIDLRGIIVDTDDEFATVNVSASEPWD